MIPILQCELKQAYLEYYLFLQQHVFSIVLK